jgi:hypothetical protein
MRRGLAALVLVAAAAAAEARAGAWLREEGRAFVSLATTLSTPAESLLAPASRLRSFASVYAEYGLTPSITLGLDAAWAGGEDDSALAALVFLRRPVWQGTRDVFATDLAVGLRRETGENIEARLRAGVSWGRGFKLQWGPGWMGLDASVEARHPSGELVTKLDATIGLKPEPGRLLILQFEGFHTEESGAILKLAPSVAWEIRPGVHLQLGASVTLAGDDAVGVKLATWFSF